MPHLHPANIWRHDEKDRGAHIADKVTGYMGSWRFLILQTIVVVLWIGLNVTAYALEWDPYPFILLNLAFSTQAAYAAPLILLAGNRQAEADRIKAEHDYDVNVSMLKEFRLFRDDQFAALQARFTEVEQLMLRLDAAERVRQHVLEETVKAVPVEEQAAPEPTPRKAPVRRTRPPTSG